MGKRLCCCFLHTVQAKKAIKDLHKALNWNNAERNRPCKLIPLDEKIVDASVNLQKQTKTKRLKIDKSKMVRLDFPSSQGQQWCQLLPNLNKEEDEEEEKNLATLLFQILTLVHSSTTYMHYYVHHTHLSDVLLYYNVPWTLTLLPFFHWFGGIWLEQSTGPAAYCKTQPILVCQQNPAESATTVSFMFTIPETLI